MTQVGQSTRLKRPHPYTTKIENSFIFRARCSTKDRRYKFALLF